jgi:hypothetical protein
MNNPKKIEELADTISIPEDEVEYRVFASMEEIAVRGNVLASGDDAADKACEDEIIRRLEQGDVWAWASVNVRAIWRGFQGNDYLGGCSYKNEDDFTQPGGYYDDMKEEALADLKRNVADTKLRLEGV